MSTLGERVRRVREQRKLTQQQLGEKVGVSKKAISKIERGETKSPTPHHLRKLASALGVDYNWILDGDDGPGIQEPQPAYGTIDERTAKFIELLGWLTESQKDELFRDLEKTKRSNEQLIELLRRKDAS